MEAFKVTPDLNCSRVSLFSKSISKPTSKLMVSRPISCSSCYDRIPKLGVRLTQSFDAKSSTRDCKNGEFVELKENWFKFVGRGIIGFAAAISVCCDSPVSAESLTFAFPISHTPEVTDVYFQ